MRQSDKEMEGDLGDKLVCRSEEMKEMKVVFVCVYIAWKLVDMRDLKVDEETRREPR